jgi:hypothetical protein
MRIVALRVERLDHALLLPFEHKLLSFKAGLGARPVCRGHHSTWNFRSLQNCYSFASKGSQQHPHFKDDILASARLGLRIAVRLGITSIIWRQKYNPERTSGIFPDHRFKPLDDRQPTAISVLKDKGLESESMENQFELFPRLAVMSMNDKIVLLASAVAAPEPSTASIAAVRSLLGPSGPSNQIVPLVEDQFSPARSFVAKGLH